MRVGRGAWGAVGRALGESPVSVRFLCLRCLCSMFSVVSNDLGSVPNVFFYFVLKLLEEESLHELIHNRLIVNYRKRFRAFPAAVA